MFLSSTMEEKKMAGKRIRRGDIYYADLIDEINREMIRANLNENEKSHLDELFKTMKRNFFQKNNCHILRIFAH